MKTTNSVPPANLFKKAPLAIAVIGVLMGMTGSAWGVSAEQATLVHGDAAISHPDASQTLIQQSSDKAIINWQAFSIGADESVQFIQPGSSAIALNRVTGGDPSVILGQLSANGRIFLLNSQGILFGEGAQINVAGLVAATHHIADQDFINGDYRFTLDGAAGSVINRGRIEAADGGYVALLGAQVDNSGTLIARQGTVVGAAGDQITLNFDADNLVGVIVDQASYDALVENRGLIQAAGGQVLLSARTANDLLSNVVNNEGVIEATGLVERNGKIVLDGGDNGIVRHQGSLSVTHAEGTGGDVQVLGDKILVSGTIDASGTLGGGSVLIGGDYRGQNPDLQNATASVLSDSADIRADALTQGDGGKVVVWADDLTRFHGRIRARGGVNGGNGGLVETSGKAYLEAAGTVDASAPAGAAGTWLLDPTNITITGATANGAFDAGDPNLFNASASGSTVNAADIVSRLNSGTSVTIATTSGLSEAGNITVDSAISASGVDNGDVTLTLDAAGAITLNQAISLSGANSRTLVLNAGADILNGLAADATAELTASQVDMTAVNVGSAAKRLDVDAGTVNITASGNAYLNSLAASASGKIVADQLNLSAAGNVVGLFSLVPDSDINTLVVDSIAAALTINDTDGFTLASVSNSNSLNATTAAGDITLQGSVVLATDLTLNAAGAVTQSGGAITAPTLSVTAGSAVNLAQAGNDLDSVNVAATGQIDLKDSDALTVTAASSGGHNITITADADNSASDDLTIAGVNAGAGTVALATSGGIRNGAAADTTAEITASQVTLNAASVGGLAKRLDVDAGTVNSTTSGNAYLNSLAASANGLLKGAGLYLSSAGDFTAIAGSDIDSLNASQVSGTLHVNDTDGLDIAAVATTGNLSVTTAAGDITLSGAISLGTGLTLNAAGAVTQSGGTVTAPSLSVTAGNGVTLNRIGNDFDSASVNAGGLVGLSDKDDLTVTAAVSGNHDITLTADADGGGSDDLTVSGINAGTAKVVLNTSGGIVNGAAADSTAELTASQVDMTAASMGSAAKRLDVDAGTVNITASGNAYLNSLAVSASGKIIADQLDLSAQGSPAGLFTIASGSDLNTLNADRIETLLEVNDVDDLTINSIGTNLAPTSLDVTAGGNVTLSGNLAVGSTLTLDAAGAVTQSGGAITAPTLSVTAGGAVNLAQAGNDLDSVNVAATGQIDLKDSDALTVTAASSGGHNITITADADNSASDDLTIAGVNAGAGTVALATSGGIRNGAAADTTAEITASQVTLNAASVGGLAKRLDILTPVLQVIASGAAYLQNLATASTLDISAATAQVATGGSVDLVGVSASALDLTSAGAITDSGAIAVTGAARFDAGANAITLGDAGETSNFGSLNLSGGAVSVSEDSASDLAGVSATSLDLTSNGAITDSGNIAVTGAARFDAGANAITLGSVVRDTDFGTLNLSGGAVSVSEDSASDLAGVSATTLNLTSNGAITDSGAIAVTGAARFDAGANAITLGDAGETSNFGSLDLSGGAVSVSEDSASDLAGVSATTLNLTSAGAISDSGNIAVSGAARFDAGANAIILGDAGETSNFGSLDLSGGAVSVSEDSDTAITQITAGTLSLTSAGAIDDAAVDSVTDITASSVQLSAATGIGANRALEISAAQLSADTTQGNVDIATPAADISVTRLSTGTGDIDYQQAGSTLTLEHASTGNGDIQITNAGDITLGGSGMTAGGSGAAAITTTTGGDLLLNSAITSAGDTNLILGGGVQANSGGNINAAGTLTINAAGGDLNMTAADVLFDAARIAIVTGGDAVLAQLDSETGITLDAADAILANPAAAGVTQLTSGDGLDLQARNGVIGTRTAPLNVASGGQVNVLATSTLDGVSVSLAGSSPDNKAWPLNDVASPGLVLFNAVVVGGETNTENENAQWLQQMQQTDIRVASQQTLADGMGRMDMSHPLLLPVHQQLAMEAQPTESGYSSMLNHGVSLPERQALWEWASSGPSLLEPTYDPLKRRIYNTRKP